MRYARALERAILARNNAFADSKLRCLLACKYSKQRKRAASGLSLNAGFFLTQRVSGSVMENVGPTRERQVTWYV